MEHEKWEAKQARGNNHFGYDLYRMCGDFPGVFAKIEFSNSETAEAYAKLLALAPKLLAFGSHFFTWHANNFEDFGSKTNDELLELANEIEPFLHQCGV